MALLVLLGQIAGDTYVLRRMECEIPDNMKSLKKWYWGLWPVWRKCNFRHSSDSEWVCRDESFRGCYEQQKYHVVLPFCWL